MGFGFASLLTSPIAQYLINHQGLVNTFYILGIVYFFIMLLSSQFIKKQTSEEFRELVKK